MKDAQRTSASLLTMMALCSIGLDALADEPPAFVAGPRTIPLGYAEPDGGIAGAGCVYSIDDGTQETSVGITADADIFWCNSYEAQGGCEIVSAVRVAIGALAPPFGLEIRVFLYDDPDDDGDPTTGPPVLLTTATGVTTEENFGLFNDYQITPTMVTGTFFVGAAVQHLAGEFPASIDQGSDLLLSWTAFGFESAADPLGGGAQGTIGLISVISGGAIPGNWMIRGIGNPVGLVPDSCEEGQLVPDGSTSFSNTTGPNERWFNYIATCPETLTVDTCGSNFTTVIAVFDGLGCPPGAPIASSANGCATPVSFTPVTGASYKIRVNGAAGATGSGLLNIMCEVTSPANDACVDALTLASPPSGGSVMAVGTSRFSHIDSDTASNCGDAVVSSPGVWYKILGTGRTLTATNCHPDTDWNNSKISVFCNTDVGCEFLICVNGNNNDATCAQGGPDPATLSTVSWCTAAGETYYILLHGFGGSTGDFTLVVSDDGEGCGPPPICVVDNSNCLFPDPIAPGQSIMAGLCDTAEGLLPADLCGNALPLDNAGRWYEAVGDGTTWTASLCNGTDPDTGLAVYTGGCGALECAPPAKFFFPDNCGFFPQEEYVFEAEFGVTYLIRVWVNFGACGNFTLSLTSDGDDFSPYTCNDPPPVTPANNCCSTPQVVAGPFPVTTAFTTGGSTTDGIDADLSNPCGSAPPPGSKLPADAQIHNDVWYSVTAPLTGDMTISICEQATVIHDEDPVDKTGLDGLFDSKLAVYDVTGVPVGDRCTEFGLLGNIIGCNEDCTDVTSEITVPVVMGRVYYARLGGFDTDGIVGGETGSGMIDFSFDTGVVPCPADTNGDGQVNVTDLTAVILAWGTANPAADVNDDGIVNVADLTIVILAWGACL